MTKTKRTFGLTGILVSVLMVITMIAGCGSMGKSDSEKIIGTWQYEGNDAGNEYWDIGGRIGANDEETVMVTFYSDGGIEVTSDGYVTNGLDSFSIVDGRLKWVLPLGTTHYADYSLKGDKLDITNEEGVTAHFVREKGQGNQAAAKESNIFKSDKGDNMFGESMSNSVVNGIVGVIAFIVTVVLVAILYIFVMPDEKRPALNKYFRRIHDFLKIRSLMIESILRFVYVFSVVYSVVGGFLSLFDNFWLGLLSIVFGPIVCRVIFEALLLNIILAKNVIEINNHLKGVEGSSSEINSNFSAEAMMVLEGLGKKIQNVTTTTNEEHVCPNCGKKIPDGSEFCIHCGSSIKQ